MEFCFLKTNSRIPRQLPALSPADPFLFLPFCSPISVSAFPKMSPVLHCPSWLIQPWERIETLGSGADGTYIRGLEGLGRFTGCPALGVCGAFLAAGLDFLGDEISGLLPRLSKAVGWGSHC